ncbi:hypothetical protein [Pseudoalteromonas luteoviolacea]|uniref:DUF1579 domain-containing protein n=1 Tax=Pseudoalteromonas luteoviolacea S4054 TaxID=1129367 RepID=A0A0F6AF64_9GAMM|nr:hypothetical protein [Pseudoalteromonas luteoviolacea]AOT10069.1 hypothetical protein S4054249_20620 [Pseudoalteromonas luteoviolacea]AOT14980.1 hypothetical protein S40542_20585 [Pseudoalteromonas luteoviolacea]AOT19897.1 hypothetical protein S4054_20595 [Pseudoalteromonas luteoviolacea]KKE84840.1 hypothetical protein N479_07015 [Pseudoalteromonas luteoviolacea S4054]KZN72457.1 hypothetical protein N481_14605 [Pseudoalteromonas luteoviolacea S4047-1]
MNALRWGLCLICIYNPLAWSADLAKELKAFAPYLGTWEASFRVSADAPAVQDVSRWERALNGTAIRTLHSINNGDYGGESLIFWDKQKQSLVFYYFTTAGFYTSGRIEVINDSEFAAYEQVVGNQDGITQVKSTSRFKAGQFSVATEYFKQGKWTSPQTRVYKPSHQTVVFK